MGADSIDNEDDQHKLLHKFEEVLLKLKYHKPYDAIQKLGLPGTAEPKKSMRQKLVDLKNGGGRGNKSKIDAEEADEIIYAIDEAVLCITANATEF